MTSDYMRLAREEKRASDAQESAQQEYRRAWWKLTLALGNAEKPGKVYAEIAPILGLSTNYLASRRGLATRIAPAVVDSGAVYSLPPRKAMAYVQARKAILDTADVVKLREYEDDGVSLRAMTADILGEKPAYWRNAEETRQLSPDQVAQAIRENPEIARRVVEDQDARLAIGHSMNAMAAERTADVRYHPERDDRHNRFFQTADIAAKIDSMDRLADEVRRLLADHAPDEITRSHYAGKLAQVGEKVNDMVIGLRSDAEFENMLAREGLVR